MDNNNTSQGFQTDRDNNCKEDIVTDKYANVSKVKPLQFLNHVYKSVVKKNQLPSYFIFYPTSRCNLMCSHCFYHDSLNKRMNELSLEEIDAFTKTMDPLLSLILTGGEPYLRHDLDQIARIFYENTRTPIITIPSNGWYLDKMSEQIRNMMKWCPELILNQLISIDGLKEDHDAIRMKGLNKGRGAKGSFDKALDAIKLIKELQKEFGRINLGIATTFTSENQHKMKDIVKGIYELAKPENITIALVRGDPKEKVNQNLDIKLYQEAVEFRNNLFYSKKMSGHAKFKGNKLATAGRIILNEKIQQIFETGEYQMPCYSANLSGVMYPEGQVHPCEILDKSHKIGNIRDFNLDFKKLWLSQKAKKEVNFIRKKKSVCTHECFNSVNILFNPKFYPKLIKIAHSIK